MNLIYTGKTKDVYSLDNGNILLKLKDDATGANGVFDPGENSVGLSIAGLGKQSLRFSKYYFELIESNLISTHYVDCDLDNVSMTVKAANLFGKGIEVICRFRATGSFIKRYGDYISEGDCLDAFVEITLKDDNRLDPPINKDALNQLNILSEKDFDALTIKTKEISKIIKNDLKSKNLDLYDIKLEFGKVNDEIILIDEISGGNMRVFKDGIIVDPMDLVDLVLGKMV